MKNKNDRQGKESGFAAIVIAITLVIVMSLLTVGFAQLMRNEQNQVTNRQLSNQAYYASESGVNDAAAALQNGYLKHKTTCGPDATNAPGAKYLKDNNVDTTLPPAGAATQWSCLLVDPAPDSLQYGSIDTVTPTIFTARGVAADEVTPVTLTSATIAWQDPDPTNVNFRPVGTPSGSGDFDPATSWNAIGMLRVTITPLTTPLTRDNLINDTFTVYLYPSKGGLNSIEYVASSPKQGPVVSGNCSPTITPSTPRYCSVTIKKLPNQPLLFSLQSIYSKTNAYITANNGTARFAGAQALVDSTGRSEDVLKRIQVRIPFKSQYEYPGFGLESIGGICKQTSLIPDASGCPY